MGAADKRIGELLDQWLASVELHTRYLELDDAAYARVQDWPKHQRPNRWIVELARTRVLDLKRLHAERIAAGDARFAEALELMGFLTNLLGSEHVERFIPLAEKPAAAPAPPEPKATVTPKPVTAPAPPSPATPASEAPVPEWAMRTSEKMTATVIADAVRLLNWGREWPQLAGLIARLAGRPPEQDIWQILRHYRTDIERQVKRAPD